MGTFPVPADPGRDAGRSYQATDGFPDRQRVNGIQKARHIPDRSCIACGQKAPKRELVRIVRVPDGPVIPDPTGRANGRGAYLCNRVGCWERGLTKRALERSFRTKVSDSDLDTLQEYYIKIIETGGPDFGTTQVDQRP